jgi:hypothetical protein
MKFQANMPGTKRYFSRPFGTRHFFLSPNQALRARLLSCCPSGTNVSGRIPVLVGNKIGA